VLGGPGLGGTICGVCTGGTLGSGSSGASGVGTGILLGGACAGRGGACCEQTFDVWYCATKYSHHWQLLGFAPAPAHGAAATTPGGVANTEIGAKAMTAAATIPSAFIS